MNRNNIAKICAAIIIVGFFVYGNTSQAAEAPKGLTVTASATEITIPKETVDAWRGNFTIADKPIFLGGTGARTRGYYNPVKIYEWAEGLEKTFNSDPISSQLIISGNKATTFTPPNIGKRLDSRATTRSILKTLSEGKLTGSLVIHETEPERSLSSTNNLGIHELIGQGKSNFKGSPKNRRHNIATGVEKLKGTIIAPGEEFSFNENICPVEKSGGWLPELVIKAEGTIPEYGGGLCQVSSTVFRAAMDAGLQIVQRKNHSYAVQYYAPQGTDATTYCGGVDFKFKNDTAASILIWPYLVGKDDLVFDIYGTKDNREIVIEKAVQYDRKVSGAMKATWVRHVTKNGVTHTDTFNSNYLSPALFHKEEKLDTPGQSTTLEVPSGTETPTEASEQPTPLPPLTPTAPTVTPPPPNPAT